MKDLIIIIMAGGLGKRMKSDIPKVLHKVGDEPMLVKIIKTAKTMNSKKIMVVVGKYKDIIEKTLKEYISLENIIFVNQPVSNGTGGAVIACRDKLESCKNYNVLVLSGDVPLISKETLLNALNELKECKIIVTKSENPHGLGRILLEKNKFVKITEEKDCNDEERKIKLTNTGIYAFNSDILYKYLPLINNNNAQNEYYLTDIIEIIKVNEKTDIEMYEIKKEKQYELLGVNTKEQLQLVNDFHKKK